jgi:hypothetical protein
MFPPSFGASVVLLQRKRERKRETTTHERLQQKTAPHERIAAFRERQPLFFQFSRDGSAGEHGAKGTFASSFLFQFFLPAGCVFFFFSLSLAIQKLTLAGFKIFKTTQGTPQRRAEFGRLNGAHFSLSIFLSLSLSLEVSSRRDLSLSALIGAFFITVRAKAFKGAIQIFLFFF